MWLTQRILDCLETNIATIISSSNNQKDFTTIPTLVLVIFKLLPYLIIIISSDNEFACLSIVVTVQMLWSCFYCSRFCRTRVPAHEEGFFSWSWELFTLWFRCSFLPSSSQHLHAFRQTVLSISSPRYGLLYSVVVTNRFWINRLSV